MEILAPSGGLIGMFKRRNINDTSQRDSGL